MDAEGKTALHLAVSELVTPDCRYHELSASAAREAVDLLLRWGADETAVDKNTPRARGAVMWRGASETYGATAASVWGATAIKRTILRSGMSYVMKLLQEAPEDRAWRRRGCLCCAVCSRTGLG